MDVIGEKNNNRVIMVILGLILLVYFLTAALKVQADNNNIINHKPSILPSATPLPHDGFFSSDGGGLKMGIRIARFHFCTSIVCYSKCLLIFNKDKQRSFITYESCAVNCGKDCFNKHLKKNGHRRY